MLTSEQTILRFEGQRAVPDRLLKGKHGEYLHLAESIIAIYSNHIGSTRRDLHRQVERVFEEIPDCPTRRIQAFIKLLDDASEFSTDTKGQAAKLRMRVFGMAAQVHPLVRTPDQLFGHSESQEKERIAQEVGLPWAQIEAQLYADVMDFHRLVSFEGFLSPGEFLAKYNVAQVQAALYRAEAMRIRARKDFKLILRYAKLAGLLLDIRRVGSDEYQLDLSGPASVLRETRRYGILMAKFLPWLLSCQDWEAKAILHTPWGTMAELNLSSEDGLKGYLPTQDAYDSTVEANFAEKFGTQMDGWMLIREGGILWENQHVFVPDFLFRHEDGTEVYLEIVGFWTPEYLAQKRKTVKAFRGRNLLLAVVESSVKKDVPASPEVIVYKTALKVESVLLALEWFRKK